MLKVILKTFGRQRTKNFEIIYAIDSEIKNKLYLLDYEILREWVHVKTLFHGSESMKHLTKLTAKLIGVILKP